MTGAAPHDSLAREAHISRLYAICAGQGLDLSSLEPRIIDRMRLLAETTETIKDCQRIAGLAERMFRYYDAHKASHRFTPIEQKTVVIGSLFSDIGKTGPAAADAAGQRLVTEMFSVERVPNEQMKVADFLGTYFPADAAERSARFRALGLSTDMSMREFWNMHSAWTLHIIQDGGMPPEAVAAAATHHLLENVNPDAIVAHDMRFTRYFGDNDRVDRPEKLVILLDKYDAARRRAHRTHAQAITWLRGLVKKNRHFAADSQFYELIDDLDVVLRELDALGDYGALD
ncbi:MAG TPA: hypothetical protein VFZ61_11215 [Polyangiales bacterium]